MKHALVCGASQGIGEATAKELASQGVQVTLLARSEDKLQKVAQSLDGQGHGLIATDISQPESWLPVLKEHQQKKAFDIVVFNSGGPKGGAISKAQPEDFLQAMQNHLVANALITGVVMEGMKSKSWGRLVTITSTSVRVPIPHLGVSNTARAAVASWAKTLSLELAPFGITVNNVMPGFTETPRLQSLIQAKAESSQKSFAEEESTWKQMVPMKRFAKPEETASLIGFLCSEKANYITGQSIAVDGGRLGCL